jgi:hypothetical protein
MVELAVNSAAVLVLALALFLFRGRSSNRSVP